MAYAKFSVCPEYINASFSDEAPPPKDAIKWSGDKSPPPLGAKVFASINGIGWSKVVGYFVEYNWLGLLLLPDNPPAWYVKQNGKGAKCHVFGAEIDFAKEAA